MNNTEHYFFRKHKLSGGWNFDIENKNLIYSDCSPTHHGLQCNFVGGHETYDKIMKLCDEIVEKIKELDKLNNNV